MSETPAHYGKFPIQPIEFIESRRLGFSLGNVLKYIMREKADDDIAKALHYVTISARP